MMREFGAMVLLLGALAAQGLSAEAASTDGSELMKLWYDKPARAWTDALPVGNGRLGAMVFGGPAAERVQFNEDTLWVGEPHDYAHEGAVKHLP
ncbi:MAG TPA: glycoside hydrolase N-terminal domain-containing protein, partial [Phycisphaerae bacterium]|nr:glycoside hydrolase N-terminal domain-containing protein [Phycisphaerae bacterium]